MNSPNDPIVPQPAGDSLLNTRLQAAYKEGERGELNDEQWDAYCSILAARFAQRIG